MLSLSHNISSFFRCSPLSFSSLPLSRRFFFVLLLPLSFLLPSPSSSFLFSYTRACVRVRWRKKKFLTHPLTSVHSLSLSWDKEFLPREREGGTPRDGKFLSQGEVLPLFALIFSPPAHPLFLSSTLTLSLACDKSSHRSFLVQHPLL